MPMINPLFEFVLSEKLFLNQLLPALQEIWLFFTFDAVSIKLI
jgi:hypothetical protein